MLCSFKISLVFVLIVNFNLYECKYEFRGPSTLSSSELSYMKKYGYLPNEPENDIGFVYTPHSISQAIIRLQHFAGLPQTGELDAPTKKLFTAKRCGNKDIEGSVYRRRRYVLQQPWNKKTITYSVAKGSRNLSKERVEQLMEIGLNTWAKHGNLTFVKVDDIHADIVVSFPTGDHGDGFAFDGEGGVMAHAFPPPIGNIHFDDDELWGESLHENEDEDVTDFLSAAVHEIGHALGLKHSSDRSSVMYPYYQTQIRDLGEDDIAGMRELYLKDSSHIPLAITVSTSPPATSRSPVVPRFTKADYDDDVPHLCYTNYDTIQVLFGKLCVFEEEWMWVLNNKKEILPGYPKRFHEVFKGLPSYVTSIKAIYENRKGNVVIFYGRKFWEFNSSYRLKHTGNLKKFKIPKYIDDLTSVFLSNYNNKTYFIAYERFWRYDEMRGRLDAGYPKSMSAWRNVSFPVDAALVWEGDTYFFQGPRFWRFENTLVAAHEYYPAPTAQIWFPCPDEDMTEAYFANEE